MRSTQRETMRVSWKNAPFVPPSGLMSPLPDEPAEVVAEAQLRLQDVAGYMDIRRQIEDLVIWPERHRARLRGVSRSSGLQSRWVGREGALPPGASRG